MSLSIRDRFGILVAQPDLGRACVAVLLLNVADASVTTIAPPFLRSLGYHVADIGILISAYAIASLFSRLPAGRLADGRHARAWFSAACVLYAVALALYPIAVEPWAFWSVRALHGLAFGATTTLNLAAVLAVGGRARARMMGLYAAFMAGGYMVGNLLSGVLTDTLGYTAAFVVAAIFPLAATAFGSRVAAPPATAPTGVRNLPALLRRREIRGVVLLALAVSLLHQGWGTLFPLYVVGAGAGVALAGAVRAMHSFANTIGRPFGDSIVQRVGPTGLGCLGLLLYAIGISALPTTTVPLLLLAIAAVIGAGRACAYLANVVTTAELSERRIVNRGTASALMTLGQDVGAILAPILAGALAGQIGIGPALQTLAVSVSVVGAAAVLSSRVTAPVEPALA